MNVNYFPENLKLLRTQKDESQYTIGKFMGKRSTAISSWEQDDSQPSLDDLIKLANYFDVNIGDLIGKDLKEGKVVREGKYVEKGKDLGKVSGKVSSEKEKDYMNDLTNYFELKELYTKQEQEWFKVKRGISSLHEDDGKSLAREIISTITKIKDAEEKLIGIGYFTL